LRFAEIDLKLIAERNSESVFIQLNEDAKSVWEQYVDLYSQEGLTPWERKAKFAAFKSKFYDYVINVPVPYDSSSIKFDSAKEMGFYVSLLDYPSSFYSYSEEDSAMNTGYTPSESVIL
jgi:CRISPR-associated endonuclease/helicase Cas3